ncbi:hypothetical protein D3C79_1022180 [compost metagenome]
MRTLPEENRQLAQWIGHKLNQCHGEVRFLIPTGGFSALDVPGGPFWLPAANQAFIDTLESVVEQTDKRRIIQIPHHINDPVFANTAVALFENIMP